MFQRFIISWVFGLLMIGYAHQLWANPTNQIIEELIQNNCASCHKFAGEPDSRFNLRGPDLMWGGSKYQQEWLINWLTGKEKMLYAKSYRWDQGWEPDLHVTVTPEQAKGIVEYFYKNLIDPRVKIGAFDLSTVTKKEVEFGAQAYKEHAIGREVRRAGP